MFLPQCPDKSLFGFKWSDRLGTIWFVRETQRTIMEGKDDCFIFW